MCRRRQDPAAAVSSVEVGPLFVVCLDGNSERIPRADACGNPNPATSLSSELQDVKVTTLMVDLHW